MSPERESTRSYGIWPGEPGKPASEDRYLPSDLSALGSWLNRQRREWLSH
jgi:hypothetical protein